MLGGQPDRAVIAPDQVIVWQATGDQPMGGFAQRCGLRLVEPNQGAQGVEGDFLKHLHGGQVIKIRALARGRMPVMGNYPTRRLNHGDLLAVTELVRQGPFQLRDSLHQWGWWLNTGAGY